MHYDQPDVPFLRLVSGTGHSAPDGWSTWVTTTNNRCISATINSLEFGSRKEFVSDTGDADVSHIWANGLSPRTVLFSKNNHGIAYGMTEEAWTLEVDLVGMVQQKIDAGGYEVRRRRASAGTDGFVDYFSIISGAESNVARLNANGDWLNRNNFYGALSDARLKRDITDVGDVLEDLVKVEIKKFRFNTDAEDADFQWGVIAQQVEAHFPDLVRNTEEGYKSVNYVGFIVKLIKAVQELKNEVQVIKSEIKVPDL